MAIRDMVARHSSFNETKDFVPTPPFATRVLFEDVHPKLKFAKTKRYWDPACGQGHMVRVFEEYEATGIGSDKYDHGQYPLHDFTEGWPDHVIGSNKVEAVITNPPYALANRFVQKALHYSTETVALLMRIQFTEGATRYRDIFSRLPPTSISVFSDRIPFKVGEVVQKAPKMFTHCWVVWDLSEIRRVGREVLGPCAFRWIEPNAQQRLEKPEDYK